MKMIRKSAVALASLLSLAAAQAATIEIQSRDPAGVGFNDPTPVLPVGGNPGTTLGEQRLNVYRYVANIWEAALQSDVKITVSAGWEALTCDAGSAVLGSAGAWNGWRDFPSAGKAGTWYPQALANKQSGWSLADFYGQEDDGTGYGNVDIKTQFNVNLGASNCLAGRTFYLGLDGNAGANVNFVATLLHELGHGLGFALFTTSSFDGSQFDGKPSIWEGFMADNTSGKLWTQMTNAERVASAINFRKLGWAGPNAVAAVPQVLAQGATIVPSLVVGGTAAGAVAGVKQFTTAAFGPQTFNTISAALMPVVDQADGSGLGCTALSPLNAAAVKGKIALIDRGSCGFVVKVKNAQNAGAVAVVIANSATGTFGAMGGADATITIPSMMITNADGVAVKVKLATRSRTTSGVTVTMAVTPTGGMYVGTDGLNRPLLYTPNPRIGGSSVSHWDTVATPNLLMEPNITPDLTTVLTAPKDLTVPLLKDLGW